MKVFCILSDERAFRSKSPVMHRAVLKRNGIDGVYVPFMVKPDRVGDAVKGLRALNIAGANVTVPYKEAVVPHLDSLSPEASAMGAVNTIVSEDRGLKGFNTDAAGFMDALRKAAFSSEHKSVLVCGTGGASRAVGFALNKLAVKSILLAGRNVQRTAAMAGTMNAEPLSIGSLDRGAITANLVVNATSVSNPAESPELASVLDRLDLRECELVVDLNYGREVNFWKDLAERSGAQFMDGLPMLAYQARRSFALWTGMEVDPAQFLEALMPGYAGFKEP